MSKSVGVDLISGILFSLRI